MNTAARTTVIATTAPVIFENRVAMSLIGPLIGAISGPSIARGTSFLKDKLNAQLFAKGVNIIDDPHKVRGLGSSPFDDEGVANRRWALIEDGVLTTWLMNTSSARQLGLETTGHASRGLAGAPGVSTTNLTVEPGAQSQAELIAEQLGYHFVSEIQVPVCLLMILCFDFDIFYSFQASK